MLLSYSAQIFAVVAFSKEELDLLFRTCDNHYDSAVAALVKQGGCLYGARNVNTWYLEDTDPEKKESDYARPYAFRDIDKMTKSLEMYVNEKEASQLYTKLFNILKGINERTEVVNKSSPLNEGFSFV